MELMIEITVKPKIIPVVNNIYNRRGVYPTIDELNQYAQKFMSINHDRFVCDIENLIDVQQKGRLLTAKVLGTGDVDIRSARVLAFNHDWENHELNMTFRISIQPKSDDVELHIEQLRHYIFKWMRVEGAYIGLGDNEYWGDNGVVCTFRVEIEESDVDVVAFILEE